MHAGSPPLVLVPGYPDRGFNRGRQIRCTIHWSVSLRLSLVHPTRPPVSALCPDQKLKTSQVGEILELEVGAGTYETYVNMLQRATASTVLRARRLRV